MSRKHRSFADALRVELEAKGWSQAEFARITGIPQPTISAYMVGRREPQLDVLEKICHHLPGIHAWVSDRVCGHDGR